MTPDGPQGRIAAIEAEIDRLEAAIERCRKTVLVGRALVLLGVSLLLVASWGGGGTPLIGGVAAALGGLVFAGSTASTRRTLLQDVAALGEERAALIDSLSLTLTPSQEGGQP